MGRKSKEVNNNTDNGMDYKKLKVAQLRELCDASDFELHVGKVLKKSLKKELLEYLAEHGVTNKLKVMELMQQDAEPESEPK